MQIILIFILPVFLIYFNVIPSSLRILVLAVSSLLIYGIIRHENWTYEDMGIRHDNFRQALPFYIFFTVIGLAALFFIEHRLNLVNIHTKMFYVKTFIFFLPSCFFQEFVFRSFLIPKLKLIFDNNKYYVIFVNALIFSLMHIIYFNLGVVIPLVFLAGVLLAWLYIKYPNLILIAVAHSILNLTAVLLGFFIIS